MKLKDIKLQHKSGNNFLYKNDNNFTANGKLHRNHMNKAEPNCNRMYKGKDHRLIESEKSCKFYHGLNIHTDDYDYDLLNSLKLI